MHGDKRAGDTSTPKTEKTAEAVFFHVSDNSGRDGQVLVCLRVLGRFRGDRRRREMIDEGDALLIVTLDLITAT